MANFSHEIRRFADSRETSYEIAQAIFDLFPGQEEYTWEAPESDEIDDIVSLAWELAEPKTDELYWGNMTFRR